jgi:AmiR/NasT family two-component response regulator
VVEAWQSGRTVLVGASADEPDRWPAWTARAEALGIHVAAAVPLCAGGSSFGALVALTARSYPLARDALCAAEILAHVAALMVVHDRNRKRDETLIRQLETALSSRVVIEQAKGVLAERGGIALDDAFDLLRRYSRSRGLRVAVVAGHVVTGRLDLTPP